MQEIWKDITGYEGLYQVSNLGRVKSLSRLRPNGGVLKEKILKSVVDAHGYLMINIYKDGKQKSKKIHQLVAQAFFRHTPSGYKIVVDHIDNNPLNNRVDNLQLTTARHNSSKDIDKTKTSSKYTGIYWNKVANKWIASIWINNKRRHLGCFDCEYSAHLAYQEALKELSNIR